MWEVWVLTSGHKNRIFASSSNDQGLYAFKRKHPHYGRGIRKDHGKVNLDFTGRPTVGSLCYGGV